MARRPGGTHLLVGAVPVLGERWLLPRLPAFTQREPSCTLHVQVFPTHIALDEPPYDVAVQYDDAPWPGALAVWRSDGEGAPLALHGSVDHPACLGRTLTPLPPGPLWRLDRATRLDATLRNAGALGSIGLPAMLAGANLFAVIAPAPAAAHPKFPHIRLMEGMVADVARQAMSGRCDNMVGFVAGPPIMVDHALRMLIREARLSPQFVRYDKFA